MAVYPERRASGLSGKWIAEVTQHGDRRRKRFDTKRDAELWADFIKVTGAPPAPAAPGRTFGAIAEECARNHPGWNSVDVSRDLRLGYVVRVLGASTPITDIRRTDLERLVEGLKKRPSPRGGKLTPATINRYLATTSAVLKFAKSHEYIVGVPSFPWQREDGHRIHWLTETAEEAVRRFLVNEGRDDEELTLRVLTATGMRWGEFAGLTVAQVDGEWVRLDRTKSNTSRDVPIAPELAEELRNMIILGAVPTYYAFRKWLGRALKSAGQSEALTIHCLRHTTATRLVHADVNLSVVRDFLGHSNIKTTLKYTHVTKSLLKEARDKISPHAGQSTEVTQEKA